MSDTGAATDATATEAGSSPVELSAHGVPVTLSDREIAEMTLAYVSDIHRTLAPIAELFANPEAATASLGPLGSLLGPLLGRR